MVSQMICFRAGFRALVLQLVAHDQSFFRSFHYISSDWSFAASCSDCGSNKPWTIHIVMQATIPVCCSL